MPQKGMTKIEALKKALKEDFLYVVMYDSENGKNIGEIKDIYEEIELEEEYEKEHPQELPEGVDEQMDEEYANMGARDDQRQQGD